MQNFQNIYTNLVRCNTQGGDFNASLTTTVETFLTEIYATKIPTLNFHIYDLQDYHRYDTILECAILSSLNIHFLSQIISLGLM